MRRLIYTIAFLLGCWGIAYGQSVWMEHQTGGSPQKFVSQALHSDREVSAANTAVTYLYDIGDLHNGISIYNVCSGGTAAVGVYGSTDQTNYIEIDSISAALTVAKVYGPATAGTTIAISPLDFRYLKITVAACGSGDTSTLTISGK